MDLSTKASGIGSLAEPVRRALYEYVAAQPEPVGREEAAKALRVPLHTAKFHLDRLVDGGLLDMEFKRIGGRTGPGAGRPAKLYRRSEREFSISLPPRRYDLVGDALASDHTALVCSLNQRYIQGIANGLGATHLDACLEPQDGLCCVKTRRR